MKTNLLFDFTVDKENHTISVKKEFNADIEMVWDAWTRPELLDQWWGPKPWRAETKSMDFREGGSWLYAMIGPEGEKHWSIANYVSIQNQKLFTLKAGFCDEEGNINPEFAQNFWENNFTEKGNIVEVYVLIKFNDLEHLQQYTDMGFKEGFTICLQQLDQLFDDNKN